MDCWIEAQPPLFLQKLQTHQLDEALISTGGSADEARRVEVVVR